MIRFLVAAFLWLSLNAAAQAETATAMFAGGCFWCMEAAYQEHEGVIDVVSGFTGGTTTNPTYSGDHKGHFEAVKVTYDPAVVSYKQLLDVFWVNIDPFDKGGQFCDRGPSYLSAIFPATAEEQRLAEQSRADVVERFAPQNVYTRILPAGTFWPVEDRHQDYYLKNPVRYKYYRWNCGRDQRLESIWGSAYIHLDPGVGTTQAHDFVGLEVLPLTPADAAGVRLVLFSG